MPQFYFSVQDGRDVVNVDSLELPDFDAARIRAVQRAAALLQTHAERFTPDVDWSVKVTDATGLILLTVDLTLSHSAAVNQRR